MRGNNGFIGKPKPNRNIGSQYSNSTEIALNSHKDGSGIRDLQSNFHEVKGFNGNAGFFGGPRIPQVAKIDNTSIANNYFKVQLQTLYNSTGSVGGQQSISIIGSNYATIGTERNTNITVTVWTKGIPRGDAIYFVLADDDNINTKPVLSDFNTWVNEVSATNSNGFLAGSVIVTQDNAYNNYFITDVYQYIETTFTIKTTMTTPLYAGLKFCFFSTSTDCAAFNGFTTSQGATASTEHWSGFADKRIGVSSKLQVQASSLYSSWPVPNPAIQWVWEADGFLTGSTGTISANTATTNQDSWGFHTNAQNINGGSLTETQWIADKDIVKSSYTTNSGKTRYYLTFENDLDFTLNSNSSDGNAIRTNGGYTFFYVKTPWPFGNTNTNIWGRYMIYNGLSEYSADFTGGRNPTIYADQYREPGIYEYHHSSNYDQNTYYFPRGADSGNNTYSAYSYRTGGAYYARFNASNLEYHVVTMTFGPANTAGTDFINSEYRESFRVENTLSGGGTTYYNVYQNVNSGHLGEGQRPQDVDTTLNNARPFFHDSAYWSDGAHDVRWVAAGWANRPYSTTERTNLINHLVELYGG